MTPDDSQEAVEDSNTCVAVTGRKPAEFIFPYLKIMLDINIISYYLIHTDNDTLTQRKHTMKYSVSLVLSIEADNEQEAIEQFCADMAVGNFDTDQMEVEEERDEDILFTEKEIQDARG